MNFNKCTTLMQDVNKGKPCMQGSEVCGNSVFPAQFFCKPNFSKKEKSGSVLPMTQQTQTTSEGPTGLVFAQQAYRCVEVLRKLGTKRKLEPERRWRKSKMRRSHSFPQIQ